MKMVLVNPTLMFRNRFSARLHAPPGPGAAGSLKVNFSFLVFPSQGINARSLLKESTLALTNKNTTNLSLYTLAFAPDSIRVIISSYIPRWVETLTPRAEYLVKCNVVINNRLNEWCCLLECYVVINESSQSQFEY